MARRRRLLQQAADETLLRYGPEERALSRLLRESRANFKLGIKAEEATAAGVKAVAKAAKPLIRRTYENAGSTFEQADQDLQTLGGASSDAAVREAAGARRRLAEAAADADAELTQRGVDAETGRAYGVRQRRQEYQGERAKILEDQRALRKEEGLYASTTYRALSEAEAKLALERRRVKISLGNLNVSRRNAAETRRHNRETEANARAEERRLREKDEKDEDKPRFTPIQRRDARAMWNKAKLYAEELERQGVLGPKTIDKVVLALTRKDIKEPIARAVVQVVLYGGVKRKTRKRIRRDYGLRPKVREQQGTYVPPVLEPFLGGG